MHTHIYIYIKIYTHTDIKSAYIYICLFWREGEEKELENRVREPFPIISTFSCNANATKLQSYVRCNYRQKGKKLERIIYFWLLLVAKYHPMGLSPLQYKCKFHDETIYINRCKKKTKKPTTKPKYQVARQSLELKTILVHLWAIVSLSEDCNFISTKTASWYCWFARHLWYSTSHLLCQMGKNTNATTLVIIGIVLLSYTVNAFSGQNSFFHCKKLHLSSFHKLIQCLESWHEW